MPKSRKDLARKQRRGGRRPPPAARSKPSTLPTQEALAPLVQEPSTAPALRSQRFVPDYSYVFGELKEIGIIGGAMIILLIILSFVL